MNKSYSKGKAMGKKVKKAYSKGKKAGAKFKKEMKKNFAQAKKWFAAPGKAVRKLTRRWKKK